MEKGKLFVFEGIDGCGKTTLVNKVYEYFNTKNIKVIQADNFFESELGVLLRKYAVENKFVNRTHIQLLYVAMLHEVDANIRKYLDSGYIVLCSRWYHSTLAYGSKYSSDFEFILKLIEKSKEILSCEPTKVYYLNIDPTLAFSRIQSREDDDDVFSNSVDKLRNTSMWYAEVFKFPDETHAVIDVNNLSIDGVVNTILSDIYKDKHYEINTEDNGE